MYTGGQSDNKLKTFIVKSIGIMNKLLTNELATQLRHKTYKWRKQANITTHFNYVIVQEDNVETLQHCSVVRCTVSAGLEIAV